MNHFFSEEQMGEITKSVLPAVVESVKAELKQKLHEQIAEHLSWSVREALKTEIMALVQAEIAPALRTAIDNEKEGIVALAAPACQSLMSMLQQSLEEHLREKLKTSWQRGQVMKALFE